MKAAAILLVLVVGSCGNAGSGAGPGSGSSQIAPVAPVPTAVCPGGSLQDASGKCVVVVTAPKIAAIRAQKTRIDDLGSLLDKVDTLAAPIELLNGIRQLDEWKTLASTNDKFAAVDTVVATLDTAVKQLRAFRGNLGEVSTRLGNLAAELDKIIAGTGYAKSLADARAQISAEVRGFIKPYAKETADTIQQALKPVIAQLADVADLLRGACAMAKLAGGGDHLKDLCTKANDTFKQALDYVDSIKAMPAALFDELTAQLVGQLDQLIDDGTKTVITAAQKQVDTALDLPAAGSGSGSAGSGSN
jgi:uncharacterized phage infection (PIP) family protein YhgE